MKFYTGIGSRSTPVGILQLMERLAAEFTLDGFTLRSGHATGADQAFEAGSGRSEIHLPWPGFEDGVPLADWQRGTCGPSAEALRIAQLHHPAWDRLTQGAKKLHGRNTHQVLGCDCATPSKFVVCWTPQAQGQGGTGQALRLAKHYDIPIFDLGDPRVVQRLSAYLVRKEASTV